ncbi:transposase family protein [Streptomyces sp. NPDC055105]|uniref:transposase family protein n=1 Tax=Streptomyces sp. NPDC055105 TaxID=3365719 RepID=UPI0037D98ED0
MHLHHQLPHEVLAELYGVDRSTVPAIWQVWPLLAARGFAVPDRPGVRLRTLEDVFADAETAGVDPGLDGAETQVRRPRAARPGRRAFVSGKRRQNTIKTTTFSDGQGRMLLSGVVRPGRMHDQTALRTEGFGEQLRLHPSVMSQVDAGYARLAKESPARSPPRPRSRRTTRATVTSGPGTRRGGTSPQPGSVSSTPTPSCGNGHPCGALPDAVKSTRRPTWRSLAWSPTAPHSGPPGAGRAPHSSSSATAPADHTSRIARPARPDLIFPRGRN